MEDKQSILKALNDEYASWEGVLSRLNDDEITARQLPDTTSIKDMMAHLYMWQQVSIARLEAATQQREPQLPATPARIDLETEEDLDAINAWIQATYRDTSWPEVHRVWSDGFRRFVALGEQISADDLVDTNLYPWLHGYALMDVLTGSYEHHHVDHLEPLLVWLRAHGHAAIVGAVQPES